MGGRGRVRTGLGWGMGLPDQSRKVHKRQRFGDGGQWVRCVGGSERERKRGRGGDHAEMLKQRRRAAVQGTRMAVSDLQAKTAASR